MLSGVDSTIEKPVNGKSQEGLVLDAGLKPWAHDQYPCT
jgi:hypothetical protein